MAQSLTIMCMKKLMEYKLCFIEGIKTNKSILSWMAFGLVYKGVCRKKIFFL